MPVTEGMNSYDIVMARVFILEEGTEQVLSQLTYHRINLPPRLGG